MSSDEELWSVLAWQCGMGIADECSRQAIDWDEPRSWQSLVDQIMPLFEFGVVFGLQYAAQSVGPGTIIAFNSLRCMINSSVASLWQFAAGIWLLIKYSGNDASARSGMDTAYQYVCTCLIDLNGIKGALGATAESNAAFSSCSERGAWERIQARQVQDAEEERLRLANEAALLLALKNKKINEVINEFKRFSGCEDPDHADQPPALDEDGNEVTEESSGEGEGEAASEASSEAATEGEGEGEGEAESTWSVADPATCFAAIEDYSLNAGLIHAYWTVKVWSSGGLTSNRNKENQTNLQTAEFVSEGVIAAKNVVMPARYNDYGVLISCLSGGNSGDQLYGDSDCEDVIAQWVENREDLTPPPCLGQNHCNTEIQCFEGNDAENTEYNTTDDCDLVERQYGYYQWMARESITCNDGDQDLVGYDNCFVGNSGDWRARSLPGDGENDASSARYRSLGGVAAAQDVEGNVRDTDIECLNDANTAILFGAENCWPMQIDDTGMNVGVQTGAAALAIRDFHYLWLTQEGILCVDPDTAEDLTGWENCEVDTNVGCLDGHTIDNDDNICVGTWTWKARVPEEEATGSDAASGEGEGEGEAASGEDAA